MQVSFDHAEQEAPHITTFYFQPSGKFIYTAGQFIELSIPFHHPHRHFEKRWFTLSSSPSEELLSITTKLPPGETHAFKKALAKLQSGDSLEMSEPMGDFVLPKLIQTPLIFVAGGIGITPMRSMLKWLIDTSEKRPIKLLYAVRKEEDIIFQDIFDKAGQHVTLVVAEPSASWGGERGYLNAEMILGLEHPDPDSLIYLSGPDPFVEAMQKDLARHHISRQQIVTDAFLGYQAI